MRPPEARLLVSLISTENGILQFNLLHMGSDSNLDNMDGHFDYTHDFADYFFAYDIALYKNPKCVDRNINAISEKLVTNVDLLRCAKDTIG